MAILWLPDLDRNEHPRSNPWTETSDPKGCIHTTEGGGWPTYSDWTIMPHGTIMPIPNVGVRGRQHLPLNQGSFSLRNLTGGVQTDRDYVFQWELIGTCEKGGAAYRAGAYYWPDADDAVLLDLYQKLIKPLSDAYGIPLRTQPFQSYPASYGARGITNTVRMSGAGFDSWSGWLGHQHVPENVHGDPGAFPWARMMAAVAAAEKKETDMDWKEQHTLTAADARDLGAKEGDPRSVGAHIRYPPGVERVRREQTAAFAAVNAKLSALTAAVTALAAGSAKDVQAAFDAGIKKFDAAVDEKFAALDVHVTITGDDDDPKKS